MSVELIKPKPFVKWVGGKRQLLAQYKALKLYPPKNFDPLKNRYFEPFVGGGALFFDLVPKQAILSDLNSELMTTYSVIKDNVENLIQDLKKHEIDREYFFSIRGLKPADLSPLQIASRFIYLNKTCFNGLYRVNKSGEFNVSFGRHFNPRVCDEPNLRAVSLALQNVTLQNADYSETLNFAQKNDFIYIDPPYDPTTKTANFTSYTTGSFGQEEQKKLSKMVMDLNKKGCLILLSNSNTPFIRELYEAIEGFRSYKVNAGRVVNANLTKRGKIQEIVFSNFD